MGQWIGGNPMASAYYFSDAQGNVAGMVYPNKMMAAQYYYDPFGNLLAMKGPLASANRYCFSSKEWDSNSGLYYFCYRFYDPNLQRWLNRDPLGELGFQTLHLVSQPLHVRKLRFEINDLEMQSLLANAIKNGSIDVGSYLRKSHAIYKGNSISGLAFLNLLRNGHGAYVPYWPSELLKKIPICLISISIILFPTLILTANKYGLPLQL